MSRFVAWCRVVAGVSAVTALGCKGEEARRADVAASPGDGTRALSVLRARPSWSLLAAGAAQGFDTVPGGLVPRFTPSEKLSARVVLPARSSAPLRLEDTASGAGVEVALEGARDVAGQTADGYVIYPGAHAAGGTLLHRALPAGLEDFISFETAPRTAEVRYRLRLGQGVKGLRLVDGTLEMLDAGGAPRLRVEPPYVVGADGARVEATLAVEGCAVDRSSAPPWGRAVMLSGGDRCAVRVSWEGAAVAYPAVLDPRWTSTASMATARQEHTTTLLSTGKVLVTGGRSDNGTGALASAELYDPTTKTWTGAGSITSPTGTSAPRRLHTAVQLGTTSNTNTTGRVLVAGGISGTTSIATTSLYNPSTNTWAAGPSMTVSGCASCVARHEQTATLLASGNVVLIGGLTNATVLASAEIYNPGGTGTGSFSGVTAAMSSARRGHTATLLKVPGNATLNNKVLVVGGNNGAVTPVSLNTAQVFDGVSTWTSAGTLSAARAFQTATALSDGRVLIAGGKTVTTTATTFLQSTQIFNPASGSGSWTATAGTMQSKRIGHSATLLPTAVANGGKVVLLVGGSSTGTDYLSTAELWDGNTTWTATSALTTATPTALGAVKGHGATLLGNNLMLIAGGVAGSNGLPTQAAGLYDVSFGVTCTSNSQCATGFCASGGVCCDASANDGNPCTTDSCTSAGVVTHTPLASGTACDDATVCNGHETCNATGTCVAGTPLVTNDNNPCTTDACNPTTGVTHTPVASGTACDDATVCNGHETCNAAGTCVAGTAPVVNDNNPCTTDACNATTGVSHTPVAAGTACDDATVCNGHETCDAAGACAAGTPLVVNDNNPCTTDACNATTGVSHTPVANGTACNDNNACTNGEACQNGACTGGTAVTCAADQCHTGGSCVPATGCASTNKPDGTPCDDGNACTKGDVCNAGTCQGPTPFTCVPIDSCQDPGTCNPARPAPPPPATDWSLSAWWKMEGDGADASGLGHPLANAGAVPAPGRFGLGMKFDGSACMTTPIFDANGNTIFGDLRPDAFFTMMAWIKPADDYPCPSNDNTVMGRAWDYSMGTVCPNNAAAGPTITGMARSDGDETTSGYPAGYGIAQRGQWTHVAMVHDGQHMIVYYNGKKAFAGPPISEISDTAPVFAVGCMIMPFAGSTTEVNTFHGTIDEVMVFQRDLTADEIWSYYSAADPCDHTVHPNGSACTDNDVCTQTDTCQSGRCTGGNPLVCTRPNTCHLDATCDRVAGCVSPAKPDGTYCDDGQTCTQGESCQGGACQAPSSPYPIVLNVPVEDLGSLPSSPSSFVYDINAAGTSAGSGVINNQAHAWLADGPGSMFDLGTVVASNTNSAALAINDGGTAVGWYQATDGYHAFRWGPPGSGTEDLGTIGDGAFPWDINNAGQFAGNFMTGFYTHGFRYTDGVGVEEVGDLGWPVVGMFGISENGVAVGYADKLMNGFVNQRAVMYENDVIGLVDLNDLIDPLSGWTLESAFKISGDFVIGSGQYNGQPRSFRLRLSTGTVDDVSGNWMSTSAWAVNAFGDVVGYGRPITTLLDGTPASEFVFTDDLGFKNLNDLLPQGSGWSLQSSGVSINNSRQIVGSGTRTGFTGTRIFRMQLPNAHKSSCEARAVCGGGNGDAICLFSDGVVELTPGHFVALFGYDNASSGPVVPAQNEIRIDGNLVPNPQQPPPNILGAGTYAAIFQPTFDVGHTISWTVDGETVTASASSPKLPTTRVGATCILVYVGGQPWYFGATGLGCGDSRHGRIEAESFDARADGSIPHEAVVDHLSDGSWLQYNRVDFGQSGEFNRIRLSVISPSGADQIVVHIDAVDGPVVANLQTFETGPGYIEELAPLSPPPTGIHDVYIVFNGSESAGLDWFDLQQGPAPRAVVVAAPGAPPDAGFPDADYTAEQEEGDSPGPEAWLSLKNPLPIQPHAFDGPSFTSQVRGTVTAVVKWTGGTGPVSVTVVDAGGNTVPGSTETNGNRIKVDTKPLPAQLFHIFIHNDGNAVIQASTLVGFTRSP